MKHTRQGRMRAPLGRQDSVPKPSTWSTASPCKIGPFATVQAHRKKVTTGRGSHNSDARPSTRPGNYPGIETPSKEALLPDLTAESNVPEPFNLGRVQGLTPDVHTGEVGAVSSWLHPDSRPRRGRGRGLLPLPPSAHSPVQ